MRFAVLLASRAVLFLERGSCSEKNFYAKKIAGVLKYCAGPVLGGRCMWWLLLVLTVEGYRAEAVYATEAECKRLAQAEDLCVPVQLKFVVPEGVPVA